MTDKELKELFKKVIKYLNPSFYKKIFSKKINKLDLTWVQEDIKKQAKKPISLKLKKFE